MPRESLEACVRRLYTLLAGTLAGHYRRLVATEATVLLTVYAVRADCRAEPAC